MSEMVNVCVRVSGVPDSEGSVLSADALRGMAAEESRFWIKEKPDGRVELWTKIDPIAKPLSSKEDLPNKPS